MSPKETTEAEADEEFEEVSDVLSESPQETEGEVEEPQEPEEEAVEKDPLC